MLKQGQEVKENKELFTEKNILDVVRRNFDGHKYQLSNVYVFDWECDYFGMTDSKYIYEIEIKISRADFKADKEKVNKHRQFQAKFCKQKNYTLRGNTYYYVWLPCYDLVKDDNGRYIWKNGKIVKRENGNFRQIKACYKNGINLKHKNLKIELLYSNISFNEIKVPHRFYYCVPDGMISKEEVPKYAGLLYTDGYRIWQIKPAPFIHKSKLDLTQILLDKFYYLSLNQNKEIYWLKNPSIYERG